MTAVHLPLPLDSEVHAVAGFLECLDRRAVRHVYHAHVVHVGDDVVHFQPEKDAAIAGEKRLAE